MVSRDIGEELQDIAYPLLLPDGSQATLCRLSAAGMDIETTAPLHIGQELEFDLQVPGSRISFTATGIVVAHVTRAGRAGFRVNFTRLQLNSTF